MNKILLIVFVFIATILALQLISKNIIATDKGTIRGRVLVGPTCPLATDPFAPNCDDKPYKTTVRVIEINSPKSSPFAAAETDDQGRYMVTLPTGKYALQPIGGNPLPTCETINVAVELDVIKEVNLYCDTGVR